MSSPKIMSVGQRLRRERTRLNWSQERLAEALGTSSMSINRWEHDKVLPQPHYRELLCRMLNVSSDTLFAPLHPRQSTTETSPLPWNIPFRRNQFFTGRESVLTHLHDLLCSSRAAALTQAISGLGGIGKTQIATEYAYRYRTEYAAVLWVRAETFDNLITDFTALAALLNVPEKDEQDQRLVIEGVKRWLFEHRDWLLVLDNAEDFTLLDTFLPAEIMGHLVLTTRAQSTGTLAQRIDLEQMSSEEGALFLLRRAKLIAHHGSLEDVTSIDQATAREICHLLDGLPLALDQAGAYIEETGCGLNDYLDRYQQRSSMLLDFRGKVNVDHPASVTATFSLCFERVEQSHPAATELLQLCAFLHPDAIFEEMIVESADESGPVLQPIITDPLQMDAALATLRNYSLLRRNTETRMLTIHRLVQVTLKDRMDEKTQFQWAQRTVRMVHRVFPDAHEVVTWPRCQRYLPHTTICAELIEKWNIILPEAGKLLYQVGSYLVAHAQFRLAESFLKKAQVILIRVQGEMHPDVAASLSKLGELYYLQNKFAEAKHFYQHALLIREKALGTMHPDVGTILAHMASLAYDQGNYDQAEQLYQRALSILEQTLGLEHPEIARSLDGLATLYETRGNYDQAEQLYQRALSILEQTLGLEHPDVGACLSRLATLYRVQSKYEQAENLHLRALALREKVLGLEHLDVANSLNNLAVLYDVQGKHDQAEPLYLRALALRENSLGPDHADVAMNLSNLAALYRDQGNYEQAKPLYERAIALREKILGDEHPDVAISVHGLATMYFEQRKDDQAEQLYRRSLTIWKNALGSEHPYVARSLHGLARLYTEQGLYARAEPLYQQALSIREKVLGLEHPDVVATRQCYATLLSVMKRDFEAIDLFVN